MRAFVFIIMFVIAALDSSAQTLPDVRLEDTAGNTVKLSSFKGKILYLDFWETTCTPCIRLFPAEEKLQDRITSMGIDTQVLIIKICAGSPREDWLNLIRQHHSTAVNLFLPGKDFKIWRRFKIPYYPTYQLIGKDFRYLGIQASKPDDLNTDYALFRAINNIPFETAVAEFKNYQEKIKLNDPGVPDWFTNWLIKVTPLLNQ